jgi:selenocysteine lyase/cysteine desulfurase
VGGGVDDVVVFVGPFEHHSNELPWRESPAEVVVIREDGDGRFDLEHLRWELEHHAARRLKIGTFSAASNVTGIVTNTEAVSILLHRHGTLACWDYAAAAPHLPIDMNPVPDVEDGELAYKDAVFMSPHKLPGGPGSPGVLVAKRHLFTGDAPAVPGGGTILYVTAEHHTYHFDPAVREEGGTPAIVESIRSGLAFQLREDVGTEAIQERETDFTRRALGSWTVNPRLLVLGNPELSRVPIVSFGIRYPLDVQHEVGMLHPDFVVALLGDLFGIQARSGCFCAGPYIHRLIDFDLQTSAAHEAEVARGRMGMKIGFTRVSFSYLISETAFEYIVAAVDFLADHAWKLLPLYRFDPARDCGTTATGSGSHRSRSTTCGSRAWSSAEGRPSPCCPATSRPRDASSRNWRRTRRRRCRLSTFPPSSSDFAGSRSRRRLSPALPRAPLPKRGGLARPPRPRPSSGGRSRRDARAVSRASTASAPRRRC